MRRKKGRRKVRKKRKERKIRKVKVRIAKGRTKN